MQPQKGASQKEGGANSVQVYREEEKKKKKKDERKTGAWRGEVAGA